MNTTINRIEKYNGRLKKYNESYTEIQQTCKETSATTNRIKNDNERIYRNTTHGTGLEINILRQWTTGPPALRIWWSGLKSGGPENYILHFHLKCIYRTCTVKHSYLTHTHSVLTVYHLNTG